MEIVLNYFETIPSSHRSLILVAGITFFWLLEYALPLFRFDYKKFKHAWPNIFFTITTAVVNLPLAFLLVKTSDWTLANEFGILQWIPSSIWLKLLVGIAGLDLIGAWLAHYTAHKVNVLWRFHLIHHTDAHVDATTANRHHPGESVIRLLFTILGVFVLGAPIAIVFLYQSISIVLSQFNHANIALPKRLDTALSWVIVSPDMHKVHHHYALPYTDTNYGNILSIWDRLFGTFTKMDSAAITYGVDTHMELNDDTRIGSLLKIPFEPYRLPVTKTTDNK